MRRALVAVVATLLLLLTSMGSAAAVTPSENANCVAPVFIQFAPGGGIGAEAKGGGIGEAVGGRGTGLAPTNCAGE